MNSTGRSDNLAEVSLPPEERIIRIEGLSKVFQGTRTVTAVDNMTFDVKKARFSVCSAQTGRGRAR